jgi:hypothetical protein
MHHFFTLHVKNEAAITVYPISDYLLPLLLPITDYRLPFTSPLFPSPRFTYQLIQVEWFRVHDDRAI